MPIFRSHTENNYTLICNNILRDIQLSLKAKGLLCQMLSFSEEWEYSIEGLASINKEKATAITSALKELKTQGYVTVTKKMPNETESGRIEYIYDVYDHSITQKQGIGFQGVEFQGVEIQGIENQGQLNKDNKVTSNKLNNNNNYMSNQPETEKKDTLTAEEAELIKSVWNDTVKVYPNIPKIEVITDARKRHLQARKREVGVNNIISAIKMITRCPYLQGNNSYGWSINFSWFLKPENFAKVSEGNYLDNRPKASSHIAENEIDLGEFF